MVRIFWICDNCGNTFDKPESQVVDQVFISEGQFGDPITLDYCPKCKHSAIHKVGV